MTRTEQAYEWFRDLNHRIFVKTIIFSFLLMALYWNQSHGLHQRAIENCQAINADRVALRNYIDQQLDRAETTLPTLDYYRQHPVELRKQLDLLGKQRAETNDTFAPIGCH